MKTLAALALLALTQPAQPAPLNQISVSDARLEWEDAPDGNREARIVAIIDNNSNTEVRSLEFQVTLRDADGRIVGQSKTHDGPRWIDVPPGQRRRYRSDAIEFQGLAPWKTSTIALTYASSDANDWGM